MKKTALLITFLLAFFNFNAWAGPNGYLFIIGGGDWPDGMMNRYLEIAQKFGTGKIIIFPMASSVPDETSAEEAADFKKLGVKEIEIHNLTREQAMQPDSAKILDGVGGIFFSGGDQARLMGVLLDTPIYKRLHELFYKGCIIAGTSAGAAAMSEVMITGEEVRKVEEGA